MKNDIISVRMIRIVLRDGKVLAYDEIAQKENAQVNT